MKCKFVGDVHSECVTHNGDGPAFCTHAAAELERRVEDQEALIRVYAKQVADQRDRLAQVEARLPYWREHRRLESRLARLEEEKAQAEIASRDWEEAYARTKLERDEAEVREAAMREALDNSTSLLESLGGIQENFDGQLDAQVNENISALSPDAGRPPGATP